jgi:CubicO group peptidase (beta-lactamase class C family)
MRVCIRAALAAVIGLLPVAGAAQAPLAPSPAAPAAAATAPAPTTPATLPLPAAASIPPDQLAAFVDGVVRTEMARDHIAGVEVSVVQDGKVVLDKGYGIAGPGRAVDPDRTLFRVGSISKTFTWISVLKEVEAGRMALDAPINRYLPAALRVPDAGGWRQVELRDLMSHTPGFEDRSLDHLFAQDPAKIRPISTQIRLARPARVFAPGTTPAYSNYGAVLAGEAVSTLEAQPFQSLVEREITGPLGLAHTTFREPYPARADLPAPMPADLAAQVSSGYQWAGGRFVAKPYEYITASAPAGAGSSTAGDMARYMLMILGGGQLDGQTIYGPAAATALRTPLPPTNAPADISPLDHGFMVFPLPGGFTGQGHGGDTIWFHSEMVTIPELRLGIFVTTNTDGGGLLAGQLPTRIVERFYAPAPGAALPGSPDLARQAAAYSGTWITNRRPFSGLEKFVFLFLGQEDITVTPDGRLVVQGAGGATSWVPTGAPGQFRSADGANVMSFELQNGRAVRWIGPLGVSSSDRASPIYRAQWLMLVAALAVIALIATLAGPFMRRGRELPQSETQRVGNVVQLAASGLWIVAFVGLAGFASGAGDQAKLLAGWPEPAIVIASTAALAAALLSWASLVLAPFAWWGDAEEGWGAWRKTRFTATSIVFAVLGFQLAMWGALEPWTR